MTLDMRQNNQIELFFVISNLKLTREIKKITFYFI